MKLRVYRLGRVEYEDGLELQRLFGEAVRQKLCPNVLLLLEHPPVITLGRGAKSSNVVASPEVLSRNAIEVFETNRGGDVTYHGPGQLVGYPIFQLEGKRQDVRRYVRDLEEALIRSLAVFDIRANRIPHWTGVWVGEGDRAEKIGAIGVHISRWQTSHGFALNVNTDLSHFRFIVPCGIREAGVTSLAAKLRAPRVAIADVENAVVGAFSQVFDAPAEEAATDLRTVSVAVFHRDSDGPRVLLLKRTEPAGGFWQIVTGRQEPGEAIAETARRELKEETGFDVTAVPLDYTHSFALQSRLPPVVVRETAFAASIGDSRVAPRLNSEEHVEFKWALIDEAMRTLPFKGLKEAVRLGTTVSQEPVS